MEDRVFGDGGDSGDDMQSLLDGKVLQFCKGVFISTVSIDAD